MKIISTGCDNESESCVDVCSGLGERGTCQCSTGFTLSRQGTHCEGWNQYLHHSPTIKDLWLDGFTSTVTMDHVLCLYGSVCCRYKRMCTLESRMLPWL